MPTDRSRYPANWDAIAQAVKFANGTVYHYGAHRVRLFVEGDRHLVGDK